MGGDSRAECKVQKTNSPEFPSQGSWPDPFQQQKDFEAEGEILLEDGSIAATSWGKYLKMKDEAVAAEAFSEEEWFLLQEEDPEEMEI